MDLAVVVQGRIPTRHGHSDERATDHHRPDFALGTPPPDHANGDGGKAPEHHPRRERLLPPLLDVDRQPRTRESVTPWVPEERRNPIASVTASNTVSSPTASDTMSHFEAHMPADPIAQPPAAAALTFGRPCSSSNTSRHRAERCPGDGEGERPRHRRHQVEVGGDGTGKCGHERGPRAIGRRIPSPGRTTTSRRPRRCPSRSPSTSTGATIVGRERRGREQEHGGAIYRTTAAPPPTFRRQQRQ